MLVIKSIPLKSIKVPVYVEKLSNYNRNDKTVVEIDGYLTNPICLNHTNFVLVYYNHFIYIQ